MDDLVKRRNLMVEGDASSQVFAEYMSNIIKQIPTAGDLSLLTNPAASQVSFYYKSPTTNELNANFYNNILSPRIKGAGTLYGVDQAQLLSSAFINAYNQLYLSLRYQLSAADQATMQELVAKVAGSITSLRPIWNAWVQASGGPEKSGVPLLDMNDTNTALIQMTAVVQGQWVNPDYVTKIQNDPSYPYTHMNDFNTIFNKIPVSVPLQMRNDIQDVYNAQGAAGGLTAKVSNATQILNGVRTNVQSPTLASGGLKLTGSAKLVPGMTFQPDDPITLVNELKAAPPTGVLRYSATITKATDEILTFQASGGAGISIPILDFLSFGVGGSFKTSIFQENYAGSKFTVEVVVNNPTLQPMLTVSPLLYNIATNQGWLYVDPVKQALKNGGKTDVTGFVFDGGVPSFDFGDGGDLGIVSALVLSQFLELNLTFENCSSTDVQKYFEQQVNMTVRFLGIPLGGASEKSTYSYSYNKQSDSKISVTLKPNPPGYTPGGTDITQSLCNLVAVAVTYPFAD